jgi:hypothetical protein
MSEPDTTVRCAGCRREQRVNFAQCLATGWPTCHGQTMQLASSPSPQAIDRAVEQALAEVRRG